MRTNGGDQDINIFKLKIIHLTFLIYSKQKTKILMQIKKRKK